MGTYTAVKFEVIPTGEYPVQLVNLEEVPNQFQPDQPQLQWTLEIIGKNAMTGKQIKAWSSTSLSLKGKFMRWAGILLGQAVEEGEEVDTDTLIGRQCLAVIVVKTKEDGSEFSKVEELKAPKKPRPVPPTAQASAPPPTSNGRKPATTASDDDYDPFESE